MIFFFFFFNDTATTEIYTLSLHDALPIWAMPQRSVRVGCSPSHSAAMPHAKIGFSETRDRKSTRLNSSHGYISYAVFCLKKKKKTNDRPYPLMTFHYQETLSYDADATMLH